MCKFRVLVMLPILGTFCFLAGCASPSDKTAADSGEQPYKDSDSGVVFPVHVAELSRTSVDVDDSGKRPVSARYTGAQSLDAAVILERSAKASPDQMLGQTIRVLQKNPNFVQEDYRGQRTFGAVTADCTQCSFDSPAEGGRATFKVVIVPRGAFLICFTLLVPTAQENDDVMDHFVQGVLAQSTGAVLMAPED